MSVAVVARCVDTVEGLRLRTIVRADWGRQSGVSGGRSHSWVARLGFR